MPPKKQKSGSVIGRFWKRLGPGLITGSSDDDPSGIATYSQAGAAYGLTTLWTALITFPLMTAIQEMCARIGRKWMLSLFTYGTLQITSAVCVEGQVTFQIPCCSVLSRLFRFCRQVSREGCSSTARKEVLTR